MTDTMQNNEKKPSPLKYIIPAVIVLLCIIGGLIYRAITWTPVDSESKKASEAIIRQAAAKQLTTDPNTLTDEDFAKITQFSLKRIPGLPMIKLTDVKLLEKFINLQSLKLTEIIFQEKEIASWMKLLSKLGIFNLSDRFSIDLSPLKNLSNLQTLHLNGSQISDIEPLKGLKNLQSLYLSNTQVSELEPLRGLTNLREIYLDYTQVSDLEPLKELKNLKMLFIRDCPNITDEQVKDLQKALPELKIYR